MLSRTRPTHHPGKALTDDIGVEASEKTPALHPRRTGSVVYQLETGPW